MQSSVAREKRLKLGEILVNAGILSPEDLERALGLQQGSGERLGFVLISNNYISEAQLVQALSKQLSVPWVSLTNLDITEELRRMVPQDLVSRFGVIPVYVMSKRPGDKVLYVAMDDPTNDDVLGEIHGTSGLEVKPMIAAPSEIAAAITKFYRSRWETGEKLRTSMAAAEPPESSPEPAPEPRPASPAGEQAVVLEESVEEGGGEEAFVLPESAAIMEEAGAAEHKAETEAEPEESAPAASEEEEARPSPAAVKPAPKKAVSFTFLDGTSISFAATGTMLKREDRDELDMIRHISELIAGDDSGARAAAAVSGMLELLLKRGFVTYDEIRNILEKLEKE
jgi:hypothetical protein